MDRECVCCGANLPERAGIVGVDRLEGTPGDFSVVICTACGSGTTLPIVPESEFGAFYTSDYAPYRDAPPPSGLLAGLKRRINRYFETKPLKSMPFSRLRSRQGEALDVGCGSGDLGALLISQGWRVTGVEPSTQAGEIAQKKGLAVRIGTLANVDLSQQKFDLVTFQHSLEHLYDPAADLARVNQLMNPGAQLLVTVPNFGSRERKIFGSRWFHLDLPRHRFHYTPTGIRELAERAGFEVVEVATTSSFIGLAGSISYAVFGRWRFGGGPWAARAISYSALVLLPIAHLLAKLGGGDYLHLVAVKGSEE